MPQVEPGVEYPREVPAPYGLPPGWKAVERAYTASSSCYGTTYVRFNSPDGRHKTVGSVKQAISKYAEDRGVDPNKAVKEWEEAVKAAKEAKAKEGGKMENREEAVAAFQAKYGELDGPTAAKLPGWTVSVKYLEVSGQTHVLYRNPKGTTFGTLKQIEAALGVQVLEGQELPFIEEARALAKAEWGDYAPGFNPLRRTADGSSLKAAAEAGTAVSDLNKVIVAGKEKRPARPEDYLEWPALAVAKLQPNPETFESQLKDAGAPGASAIAGSAARIHTYLLNRGFEKETGLVVVFSQSSAGEDNNLLQLIYGVYHARPGTYQSKAYFQKVVDREGKFSCSAVHIFWSETKSAWKIGLLDDAKAGLAFREGSEELGSAAEKQWMTLKVA